VLALCRTLRNLCVSGSWRLDRLRVSWQQGEGSDVVRAHDGEVAPVDRRDLGDAQPFGGGDDGRVHGAQRQVTIAGNQLCDPQPVGDGHRINGERSVGEVAEEADLWLDAEAGRQQIDDLGDDQGRDDERAGMGLEQFECGEVVCVVGVDVCVERSSVDDKGGYRATSAARISSMRSETSLRPLRPAPAAPSRRRAAGPPR
jgi:hypothetical protein